MLARVGIFRKQIDNNVLYRGIANQHSHAYTSLYMYLYDFISFHILIMNFYIPALKKWGVYWFTSVYSSVHPSGVSICPSVHLDYFVLFTRPCILQALLREYSQIF